MIMQGVYGSDLTGYRVCRMTEPTGILRTAQFSWQTTSKELNVQQMSYRILVAASKDDL